MKFFIQDIGSFYVTIYGGIIIGLLFDLYRGFRHNFKIIQKCSIIFDIIFWMLVTLISFLTINIIENFDLRYYHFVALFLGFILYYNTISRFILSLINKIISIVTNLIKKTVLYIVNILNNLYYVLIYSLHLIFDIIFLIPAIFGFIKKKGIKN
jgi:spore cortex biosynthesis protein YabQ